MRKILFLLLPLVVFFSSCEEEPSLGNTGTLDITFKVRYNDNPLLLFQNTATGVADPTSILFKRLEFFISKMKGQSSEGTSTDFADVAYISMAQSLDQESALAGTSFTIENVPIGVYTEFNFGVGLPDSVNNTSPGDYESSSSLGLNANYWPQWNSYILCKLEGDVIKADTTPSFFLLHAGVNGMYQTRSFDTNYTIRASKTTPLVFYINAEDLMFKTGSEIDIINENETHSGPVGSTKYLLAKKTLANLANALSL
jgi:hypothetical protein